MILSYNFKSKLFSKIFLPASASSTYNYCAATLTPFNLPRLYVRPIMFFPPLFFFPLFYFTSLTIHWSTTFPSTLLFIPSSLQLCFHHLYIHTFLHVSSFFTKLCVGDAGMNRIQMSCSWLSRLFSSESEGFKAVNSSDLPSLPNA